MTRYFLAKLFRSCVAVAVFVTASACVLAESKATVGERPEYHLLDLGELFLPLPLEFVLIVNQTQVSNSGGYKLTYAPLYLGLKEPSEETSLLLASSVVIEFPAEKADSRLQSNEAPRGHIFSEVLSLSGREVRRYRMTITPADPAESEGYCRDDFIVGDYSVSVRGFDCELSAKLLNAAISF